MSELSQEEIRRRRLARLAALDTSASSSSQLAPPSPGAGIPQSPSTPGSSQINNEIATPPPLGTQKSDSQSTDTSSQMEKKTDRKDAGARQRTSSSCTEVTEEQVQAAVSRVLCVTWKEQNESAIYLPETASVLSSVVQERNSIDVQDLINQALMEVLAQFGRGENPLRDLAPGGMASQGTPDNLDSPGVSSSISDTLQSAHGRILLYLMECYARVAVEERNHPKRSSIPPLSDVLAEIRAQCVQYASLALQGVLSEEELPRTSPLLSPVLSQSLPRGFLPELVARTHTNQELFAKVFGPVLQGLLLTMQNSSIVGNSHRQSIQALSDLVEIRCGPAGNVRPICRLITQQPNFLPDVVTQAVGRELAKTSFLGPFLSVSVFAEDEPKVADKFFSGNPLADKSLNQTLQQELENTRVSLHKVFHDILVCNSSREDMLNYLAALLGNNEKRAQIQVDERSLAGDGFMLNLLSIMQILAVKVKLDKVDVFYPFHPASLVDVKNDTRLRFTSQEAASWLGDLNRSLTHKWKEVKFPTHCWFLTLHCHHLALLPACHKYQRRLRALRDLQKLVDEMQATEAQWKEMHFAARNKELLKRWKQQIKKLNRSKACADAGLLDDSLLRRSLQFYTSVADFLLGLLLQQPINAAAAAAMPLGNDIPPIFSAIPEWYVEDIAEFLLFALQFSPAVVADCMEDSLITWLLVAACSPHCIKNPYMVAKIIEVLFVINPGIQPRTEQLHARVMAHPISEMHLPSCLMKCFCCYVETTGSSSEFYDKFTIRYHISLILKGMWESPVHRQAIVNES
ncbi:hypothetical protein L9F63_007780, partial [Diploptera punctata]